MTQINTAYIMFVVVLAMVLWNLFGWMGLVVYMLMQFFQRECISYLFLKVLKRA